MTTSKLMYNPDQKQEYIIYENKNTQGLANYFKRISTKEREYDKDIADMDVDEIKDTIISLKIRRADTRGHLLSLLRGYIIWARLAGKASGGDAIKQITPESISSQNVIRNQMIRDPDHLRFILDNTLDYKHYTNRSKRDSLVFWLLYSGVEFEELSSLRKDSVNIKDKTIKTGTGKYYEISEEVTMLCEHCSNMTFIEKKNGRSKESDEYTKYDLHSNEYLFRPISGNKIKKSEKCTNSTFINIVSKVIGSYSKNKKEYIKISPLNIRYSGVFYKMFLLEKKGCEITPEMFGDFFNITCNNRSELLLKTRKWRIDYDDWKFAFEYM